MFKILGGKRDTNKSRNEADPNALAEKNSRIETIAIPVEKNDFEQRIEKLITRGRKRGKRFSIIGILYSVIICALVVVIGYYIVKEITAISDQVNIETNGSIATSTAFKRLPTMPIAWRACAIDTDCVETQKTCCNCSFGGEQTGINAGFLSAWQGKINEKCVDKLCEPNTLCQTGQAVCADKVCVFRPDLTASTTANTEANDGDSDGLSNDDEIKYNTDPKNPDTDGDGYSDGNEIKSGHDPKSSGKVIP